MYEFAFIKQLVPKWVEPMATEYVVYVWEENHKIYIYIYVYIRIYNISILYIYIFDRTYIYIFDIYI